jgi:AcrR family transcriptional regulator
MNAAVKTASAEKTEKISPRERILAAASDLFYRHGIRAVGVEAIAEAAQTNKMTLYRHFSSKDELVAEYLRREVAQANGNWERREAEHPGDPLGQLRSWLTDMARHVASGDEPARRVIETYKAGVRERLGQLCAAAGLVDPDLLGDELFLLLEGARVTAQSMGPLGMGERLIRMGEAMIKAHTLAVPSK